MKPTQVCKKCGKSAWHNKGISAKDNQPYENIKCSDPKCGYIDWMPRPEKKVAPVKQVEKEGNNNIDPLFLVIERLDKIIEILLSTPLDR